METWSQQLASYVRTLPPSYAGHPVTQDSLPELCLPLAVFVDGVQYIKKCLSSASGFSIWLPSGAIYFAPSAKGTSANMGALTDAA